MSTATLTPAKTDLMEKVQQMLSSDGWYLDEWFTARQLCDFMSVWDGDDRTLSGIVQHLHGLAEVGVLEREGGGRQGRPVRFRLPAEGGGRC